MLSPKSNESQFHNPECEVNHPAGESWRTAVQRTNHEVVHADVALAGDLLRVEVVVCELVDGQVLDQPDPLRDFDLFVFGQLLRAVVTHARRRVKYLLLLIILLKSGFSRVRF